MLGNVPAMKPTLVCRLFRRRILQSQTAATSLRRCLANCRRDVLVGLSDRDR